GAAFVGRPDHKAGPPGPDDLQVATVAHEPGAAERVRRVGGGRARRAGEHDRRAPAEALAVAGSGPGGDGAGAARGVARLGLQSPGAPSRPADCVFATPGLTGAGDLRTVGG